jgi:type IV secretory pathway TrbD component
MAYERERENRGLHFLRSTTTLVIIAVGLGLIIAAVLGVSIWAIAGALHHASTA